MLAGPSEGWTDANEGPGSWSPYVVLGRPIHGERTDWIPRARIVLDRGRRRRVEPFDRFALSTFSFPLPGVPSARILP